MIIIVIIIIIIMSCPCPFDTRVEKKEKEKFEHYTDLKYELLKVWNREITKVYKIHNMLQSILKRLTLNRV